MKHDQNKRRRLNANIGGTATLRIKLTSGPNLCPSLEGSLLRAPIRFALDSFVRTARISSLSLSLRRAMLDSSHARFMINQPAIILWDICIIKQTFTQPSYDTVQNSLPRALHHGLTMQQMRLCIL